MRPTILVLLLASASLAFGQNPAKGSPDPASAFANAASAMRAEIILDEASSPALAAPPARRPHDLRWLASAGARCVSNAGKRVIITLGTSIHSATPHASQTLASKR